MILDLDPDRVYTSMDLDDPDTLEQAIHTVCSDQIPEGWALSQLQLEKKA
jgi:hypothetical protein